MKGEAAAGEGGDVVGLRARAVHHHVAPTRRPAAVTTSVSRPSAAVTAVTGSFTCTLAPRCRARPSRARAKIDGSYHAPSG